MKKIILLSAVFFLSTAAFCQQYDTTPPYLKDKLLPAFTVLNTDSAVVTEKILKPELNIIIMMYNPDCGHCQSQVELLLTMPEILNKAQIIMVTTMPLYKIKTFREKYGLDKYPNIYCCKDYAWFFGKFFQPKTIPVLAFYNKQKQFVFLSQGNATKKQIADALSK
jgi:hypothetical protein